MRLNGRKCVKENKTGPTTYHTKVFFFPNFFCPKLGHASWGKFLENRKFGALFFNFYGVNLKKRKSWGKVGKKLWKLLKLGHSSWGKEKKSWGLCPGTQNFLVKNPSEIWNVHEVNVLLHCSQKSCHSPTNLSHGSNSTSARKLWPWCIQRSWTVG